jgi:DNA-binding response OmpR family regulator
MAAPVLVVEDEADLVTTYERLLRRLGYTVISAGSRAAGIAAVQAQPLSLVVADIRLPDGTGLDVVRAARATPAPPPVMVVTGYGSARTRRQVLEAGASAYLAKPFSVTEFTALIHQLVEGRTAAGRTT